MVEKPSIATDLAHMLAAYADLPALAQAMETDLVALRRQLHAHPEVGWQEIRTTATLSNRLHALGLTPTVLSQGSGLWVDIGEGDPAVALRADIDALPITDIKTVDYKSSIPGVCHACGHDVHTSILVGAAQVLTHLHHAGRLPGRVRLIFQPAEETVPLSGAPEVIKNGGVEGISRIFGLHCDPSLPVGVVGRRVGPITAACDVLEVTLTGQGGHTGRPHLTGDLIHALATVVTDLPMALSRRVDVRHGLSVVWGQIEAGHAHNAIPQTGMVRGTARSLSTQAWHESPTIIAQLIEDLVRPYAVQVFVNHQRGTPTVDSDAASVEIATGVIAYYFGPQAVFTSPQSSAGEDFGWYLQNTTHGGAFLRLGVSSPEAETSRDLHQPHFDVDEGCIPIGVTTLVGCALASLEHAG